MNDIIREKAIEHGIALSVETDGIPEIITADEVRLKHVVFNQKNSSKLASGYNGM